MSVNLNHIYCNHLFNNKIPNKIKPQFESFAYPNHKVLTSLHIKDSIHYNALVTNDYTFYEKYITTTNQKEHSVKNFLNLKNDFDLSKMEKIKVLYNFNKNKYFIQDGVHRLSILLYKKLINDTVPIKYLDIIQNNCFYFVIYEHGIDHCNAICNEIEKNKIRIDNKIFLELPSNKFTDFIFDIYPDNNKEIIINKNKFIIDFSRKKDNIRAIILLVSIDKWNNMNDKCKEIEMVKRKIRNLYNPKFQNINKQISPLNKGVSHNHVIHSIDLPNEFLPIYDVIDKYYKYIKNTNINHLTIAQLLNDNNELSINYDFFKLKAKQKRLFEDNNQEMNVRIQNLKDVINVFNQCNVFYWLQGKTLLGMAKDNKLIQDDNDEDIGTMCDNIEKVCFEIIPKLKIIGFEVIRATANNSMVSVMRNLRYIDICFFVNKKDKIGYETKFFPKNYYDSFTELNINGFIYNVPLKFKDIIKLSYNIKL